MWKYSVWTSICLLCFYQLTAQSSEKAKDPVKLGVIGLTHSHVHWILSDMKKDALEVVGIVEPNRELAKRYAEQHGFSMDLVYNTIEGLIVSQQPQAVAAFGTIYDHLKVVQICAPQGIHVMVEKPLAVSLEHALEMQELAKKHNIHLLTNYETSWYPTTEKTRGLLKEGSIGKLTQIVVRNGHKGPKKIGINKEFLEWLTDPALNGGGAIMDFGCYGANLSTWLHDGKRPNSITAITQQLQAENNPNVDDEATIILTYEDSKTTVQASWNWPIGRKDMEVYGEQGVIYADNRNALRVRISEGYDGFSESSYQLEERAEPWNDPFTLFARVIRAELKLEPYDLYSLENNMIVMEILDAAKRSTKEGKTIYLKE